MNGSQGQYWRPQREEHMADPIVFPGTVEWSGENPGISLKELPDGPFTTLASLFRVVLSPHGRGHALMLMQSPQEANPPAETRGECLPYRQRSSRALSGQPLRYEFPRLQGTARIARSQVSQARQHTGFRRCCEHLHRDFERQATSMCSSAGAGSASLFCFALRPEGSSTGCHDMPSVFVGCQSATITVNGRVLPGKPVPRESPAIRSARRCWHFANLDTGLSEKEDCTA